MFGKSFKKVLFVGTGGGNDVFSTTLAMSALWQTGWRWQECALAGVLSPFHRHSTVYHDIEGLSVVNKDSKRFLLRYDNQKEIGFVDARVSEMASKRPIFYMKGVYGLSIARGTAGLTETFKELSNIFDLIVLVDIGGDIFYSGPRDVHVLSPMFDAIVLRAVVNSGVPSILFEAGPGTDGELEPEALTESFTASGARMFSLHSNIDWWSDLYDHWIKPVRPGRTVPTTIAAFKSQELELTLQYQARAHLGSIRRYVYHTQRIVTDLCRKFFLVEPKLIQNPFALNCDSPYDWFVKTQVSQQRTNNEANLEYLPVHSGHGRLWQFLTPSPLFNDSERLFMMEHVLHNQLEYQVCDGYWLFESDWKLLSDKWQEFFQVSERNSLIELIQNR